MADALCDLASLADRFLTQSRGLSRL